MKKINVIIDNKSDQTDLEYTYLCDDVNIKVGATVTVPFGKGNKAIRGCVVGVYEDKVLLESEKEKKYKLKVVETVEQISLSEEIVETAKWMKERYFCRFYDCLELFIPQGSPPKLKLKDIYTEEIKKEKKIDILTDEQNIAVKQIANSINEEKHEIFLLHGVTGSGKTQVYISLINELLSNTDKSAIMLVPEISLTKQIIDRFVNVFGKTKIAVLHSRLTKKQKYEQWQRIKSGEVRVVIGARSAVFAPLDKIGIVVLDEEHESTYKSDKTPKYETVEVAIKRAKKNGGSVILGSATPSAVSYQRSKDGIYTYIPMKKRYNNNQLPEVQVVDISNELKEGNTTSISKELYNEMESTLEKGKQIILFLNRRGYATYIACSKCDYVAICENCGINMTYHKESDTWDCHYCGSKTNNTKICPKCKENGIVQKGFGTEKAEEEVRRLFPTKVVERLDLDTSKKAGFLDKTLKDFGKGKIDILMGTQIVAKGLDFENVGLAGILSADLALNIPDYRSPERCFQLVTQAAGRAGRGSEKGKVIVQTFNPDNYAIECGSKHDYEVFFEKEIEMRKFLCYPPFSDLVSLIISSKNEELSKYWANVCKEHLEKMLGSESEKNIYSPKEMISLNKEIYRYYVLIKCPREEKPKYMGALKAIRAGMIEKKNDRKLTKEELQISIDINPYSIWRG